MEGDSHLPQGITEGPAPEAEEAIRPPRQARRWMTAALAGIPLLILSLALPLVLRAGHATSPQERLLAEVRNELEEGDLEAALEGLRELLTAYPGSEEAGQAKEEFFGKAEDLVVADLEAFQNQSARQKLSLLDGFFYGGEYRGRIEELRSLLHEKLWLEAQCAMASLLNILEVQEDYPRRMTELLRGINYDLTDYDYDPFGTTLSMSFPKFNLIALFVPEIYEHDMFDLILHEWGHFVDYHLLDDAERAEYRRLREIPADVPWNLKDPDTVNELEYKSCPAEDFAEVFRVVVGGGEWREASVYGEVHNPKEMEEWLKKAAA